MRRRIEKEEIEVIFLEYFATCQKIKWYEQKSRHIRGQIQEVAKLMEGCNITFCTSPSSVLSNKVKVKGSASIYNGIERQIDTIYERLEKKKTGLQKEFALLELKIKELKRKNKRLDSLFHLLNKNEQEYFFLEYKEQWA